MFDEPDYYAILGVDPKISAVELRKRHKDLVRELHPDTHAGDAALAEQLTVVNAAFHELRDEYRRGAYDRRRREAVEGVQYGSTGRAEAFKRASNTTFHSTYAQAPTEKRLNKKKALLGSLFAAAGACIVAVSILYVTNENLQIGGQDSGAHIANATGIDVPVGPVSARQQQFNAIQDDYQGRLDSLFKEVEQTLDSADMTASSLDGVGDSDSANVLRRDSKMLETKLSDAGVQVRTLGVPKDMSSESQIEASLNTQLDVLSNSDRQLLAEEQNMKTSSRAGGPNFKFSANKTDPSQDPTSPQTDGPTL